MIFIGGIANGQKRLDFHQAIICKACGRYSSLSVFMEYTYFSFFFIPIFKWNKHYYAVFDCCGAVYSIPPHLGHDIEQGDAVTLHEEDFQFTGDYTPKATYCTHCGFPLHTDYVYCPKCGRKI